MSRVDKIEAGCVITAIDVRCCNTLHRNMPIELPSHSDVLNVPNSCNPAAVLSVSGHGGGSDGLGVEVVEQFSSRVS